MLYDEHPKCGLFGRCLGNGGIPEPRKDEVKKAPPTPITLAAPAAHGGALTRTADSPGCIALDAPNMDMKKPADQQKFAPHGFMTLEFTGDKQLERVFTSDGVEIYKKSIA